MLIWGSSTLEWRITGDARAGFAVEITVNTFTLCLLFTENAKQECSCKIYSNNFKNYSDKIFSSMVESYGCSNGSLSNICCKDNLTERTFWLLLNEIVLLRYHHFGWWLGRVWKWKAYFPILSRYGSWEVGDLEGTKEEVEQWEWSCLLIVSFCIWFRQDYA